MPKKKLSDDLNKNLCLFIKSKYFSPFKINGEVVSLNKYAEACDLAKSTISKINSTGGYDIPVSTINIIVTFEKSDLAGFFTEFLSHLESQKK